MNIVSIVDVNKSFARVIAPNCLWWDLKEAGIEAWLEINVGRLNKDWMPIDGLGDSIGFRDSMDANAFRLKYG